MAMLKQALSLGNGKDGVMSFIDAKTYGKLLPASSVVNKDMAPMSRFISVAKCHGFKNYDPKVGFMLQCTCNPKHFVDGTQFCGTHATKGNKSSVWNVPVHWLVPAVVTPGLEAGPAHTPTLLFQFLPQYISQLDDYVPWHDRNHFLSNTGGFNNYVAFDKHNTNGKNNPRKDDAGKHISN